MHQKHFGSRTRQILDDDMVLVAQLIFILHLDDESPAQVCALFKQWHHTSTCSGRPATTNDPTRACHNVRQDNRAQQCSIPRVDQDGEHHINHHDITAHRSSRRSTSDPGKACANITHTTCSSFGQCRVASTQRHRQHHGESTLGDQVAPNAQP